MSGSNEQRAALCEELKLYCDAHQLPQLSADELALQIGGTNDHDNPHVRWLNDFSDRWDATARMTAAEARLAEIKALVDQWPTVKASEVIGEISKVFTRMERK